MSKTSPATHTPALTAELTLSGGTNTGTRTDAESLGRLITHLAEAAKALSNALAENRYEDSKDQNGRPTRRKVRVQPLQLEGNFTAQADQALSFTLCTPEPQAGTLPGVLEEQLPLDDFPEDTIEAQALRTIMRVLTRASEEDHPDTDDLLDTLETASVREYVRRAVAITQHNDWDITGTLRQTHREDEPITFTSRGRAHLAEALKADRIGKYQARLRGTIDGHKNSNNTIYFRPKNLAASWSMTAATDRLYAEAARISLDLQNQVDLTIEFEPKIDRQGNPTERVIRRIVALHEVEKVQMEPLF